VYVYIAERNATIVCVV